jgi:hypothetical protein
MDAYRFDPRPCRLIGPRCPAQADHLLLRLGEPVRKTLIHGLGLDRRGRWRAPRGAPRQVSPVYA